MKKVTGVITWIFIILLSIITVFPFIYMVLGGLMSYAETTSIPPTIIPHHLHFENYVQVFHQAPFLKYFWNTLLTSSIDTVCVLITSLFAAFALTSLDFKGKKAIRILMISLLMVPSEAIIFTNYNTIAKWGLLNTYVGLFLPFTTSVFYIYYLNSYFQGIPRSIYQAAKISGASNWQYVWKILVPMSKPALTTVGLLSFIAGWNSFLWPLLVTNNDNMRLLNNGLANFASDGGAQTQLQLAAATLTVIPILIIYFIFRKQIIQGVTRDGLKG
ncbi:carbohydrate ABC transporter permease [Ligilactobacillus sp. 110_WCHN]|uniref:carbohydrate ABC transporter permease n=1 Tax=Ligilactobacillus sp. 110_WCHN TaxID=3057125 RepID=UPI002673D991|nr:carbohydrate ABC transporter permease [Ligilactobacillus sp. 110_WCHN]MDO3392662.1 carbohydrate ABC transporter permease [Ligilactobacillus sp. 110_WCHN]